jgi:hypothetical protein
MEPYLAGQHLNNYLRHLSFGRATSENVFKTYLSIYYNFKKVVIDAGSVSFKTILNINLKTRMCYHRYQKVSLITKTPF